MEKAVRLDMQPEFVLLLDPVQFPHLADGAVGRRRGLAEGREVVAAHKGGAGPAHGVDVQRVSHVPGIVPSQGARAPDDPVDVPSTHRAEPGVEIIGRLRNLQHAHVRRQHAVQTLLQSVHHHVRIRSEVDDLAGRVHPGVRSAGRGRSDVGLQDLVNRRLEDGLHGAALGLDLPAEETGTVVFDLQDQGAHGIGGLRHGIGGLRGVV